MSKLYVQATIDMNTPISSVSRNDVQYPWGMCKSWTAGPGSAAMQVEKNGQSMVIAC